LTEAVRLENLLDEVGVFVSGLNKLLHVFALMVELVPQVEFSVRCVNSRLDKDSLLLE